jgi:hypothetical protein
VDADYAHELTQYILEQSPDLQSAIGTWAFAGEVGAPLRVGWHLLSKDGAPAPFSVDIMVGPGFKDSLNPNSESEDKVALTYRFYDGADRPRSSSKFQISVSGVVERDFITFMETMDAVFQLVERNLMDLRARFGFYKQSPEVTDLVKNSQPEQGGVLHGPDMQPDEKGKPAPSLDKKAKTTPLPEPDLAAALKGDDDEAIIRAARKKGKLDNDDKLDLFNAAKRLKSNKLGNYVGQLKLEGVKLDKLVANMLDEDNIPM